MESPFNASGVAPIGTFAFPKTKAVPCAYLQSRKSCQMGLDKWGLIRIPGPQLTMGNFSSRSLYIKQPNTHLRVRISIPISQWGDPLPLSRRPGEGTARTATSQPQKPKLKTASWVVYSTTAGSLPGSPRLRTRDPRKLGGSQEGLGGCRGQFRGGCPVPGMRGGSSDFSHRRKRASCSWDITRALV